MSKYVNLFVVGAVIGSGAIAEAGDPPLLTTLREVPRLLQVQAVAPLPTPDPLPMPAPGAPAVAPPAHGHGPVYPAPAPHHGHGHAHAYPVHASPMPPIDIDDPDNIHPCAVHRTVMVPNPCSPCGCEMVPVTVCVPPCVCEEHVCKKGGRYQKLDYGKYRVEIRVKDRYIEVDYDD